MNNSLKGALLSGAVFPGLGQVALKHYMRGIALMLTVFGCVLVIAVRAVQQASAILEKIMLAGGAINMNTILDATTQASTTSHSSMFSFVVLLIIICWIFAVVDAYRIGRQKDLEAQSTSPVSHNKDN
ncbi:MAG: hypothetical protein NT072_10875 [Deltaproteobacteria bacterium]|nr:hypothetical protein [Deltaproteobacteria bacterium]